MLTYTHHSLLTGSHRSSILTTVWHSVIRSAVYRLIDRLPFSVVMFGLVIIVLMGLSQYFHPKRKAKRVARKTP